MRTGILLAALAAWAAASHPRRGNWNPDRESDGDWAPSTDDGDSWGTMDDGDNWGTTDDGDNWGTTDGGDNWGTTDCDTWTPTPTTPCPTDVTPYSSIQPPPTTKSPPPASIQPPSPPPPVTKTTYVTTSICPVTTYSVSSGTKVTITTYASSIQ